jgi:lipopolysaccharide transport system permease protein
LTADPDQGPSFDVGDGVARFTSASQFQYPRQFFSAGFRSLRASVPLARRLFVRDIRARYRLSVLGFAWIFLPAVAQTAVWLYLNEANILNSGKTSIPLPLYVLLGTLLWQGFTDAISAPGSQLSSAGQMLSRVSFPAEALLLAGFADALVNTLARLLIAVPVLVYYGVSPGHSLLFAPFGLLLLLALGFAIGLVLAPFGMLYQDIGRILTIATGFWLLATPVAYAVPASGPGRFLAYLNPATPPLVATREWLTGSQLVPGLLFFVVAGATTVLLFVGWVLFRLSIPHLVDRVSS